eukprot:11944_1
MMSATKRVVSALHHEDNDSVENKIHSTAGANNLGYQDALVGGVDAFSYGYSLIIDGFMHNFLKNGYIKLKFRRPMFPNRKIKIVLNKLENNHRFSMNYIDETTNKTLIESNGSNYKNSEFVEDHCFKQYIHKHIDDANYNKLINNQIVNTSLKKHTAHKIVNNYMKIFEYKLTEKESIKYSNEVARDKENKLIHIGILLGFGAHIVENSFPHFPSIHVSSEIQFINENNLSNMKTNQIFKSYGKIVKIWKRKNKYYSLTDMLVTDQYNNSIALIRNEGIYDFDIDSKL